MCLHGLKHLSTSLLKFDPVTTPSFTASTASPFTSTAVSIFVDADANADAIRLMQHRCLQWLHILCSCSNLCQFLLLYWQPVCHQFPVLHRERRRLLVGNLRNFNYANPRNFCNPKPFIFLFPKTFLNHVHSRSCCGCGSYLNPTGAL